MAAPAPSPSRPADRTINLTLDISAPADAVFGALIDLPGYNSWLPQSGVFKGTTEVSDTPLKTGSTYVEHSPSGTRFGEAEEVDFEGRHVVFHQPMKLRPFVLGIELDVTVDMRVTELEQDGVRSPRCRLDRQIRLGIPLPLRLVAGTVEKQFRDESWRTMQLLKEHLEAKQA